MSSSHLGGQPSVYCGGIQVVQVLYEETLPTFLLSGKEGEEVDRMQYESNVLGGKIWDGLYGVGLYQGGCQM